MSDAVPHDAAFPPERAARRRRGVATLLRAAVLVGILAVPAVHYLNRPVAEPESSGALAAVAPSATAPTGFKLAPQPSSQPVPELHFADAKGKPVSLADFRGKTVLLNIWASWCPPCRAEMPALDRLQAKLGGPDFEVIPVSIDQGGSALVLIEEFFRELGVHQLPIYIDPTGQAAGEVGSVGLPTTLLIDRDGQEVGRLIGGADWDSPEAIAFIEQRLARTQQRSARPH
jgi:thiol-disulfide isomerase/thioredoxin